MLSQALKHHLMSLELDLTFLILESPGGGYEARALGHSLYTEADSLGELRAGIRDAVACHFDEHERPARIRIHYVREEALAA